MSEIRRISRNAISIFLGRSLILLLTFLSITFAARFLGVVEFGRFSALVSLLFIISRFIDFGFTQIVFREVSKEPDDFKYLNNALSLRLIFFVFGFIVYNIIGFSFNFEVSEIVLTDILFVNIMISPKFMNFCDLLELPFRVGMNMHLIMFFYLLENVLLLLLIFLMPVFNGGLEYFIFIYVVSNIPGFILTLFYLKQRFNYKFKFQLDASKWLILNSLPLLGYGILNAIFQQSDVVLLRLLDSNYSTGIYGASLRLAIPLGIVPISIITTVYPFVVRNLEKDVDKTSFINNLINKILFSFSFLAAVIVSFKSEAIVLLFFGKSYADSATPLILLFWTYVFIFFNNYYVDLLTAQKLQKYNFIFGIIISSVDLILMIYLVRFYSYNAAAIAKLIAAFSGCIYLIFIYRNSQIKLNFINSKLILWCVLVLGISYLTSYFDLFLFLFLNILVALVLVIIFKTFSSTEQLMLLKTINKEEWLNKIQKFQLFQS